MRLAPAAFDLLEGAALGFGHEAPDDEHEHDAECGVRDKEHANIPFMVEL